MREALFLLVGIGIGSAADHFLPRLWRRAERTPDLRCHVERDLSIIWVGAPPWVGASFLLPSSTSLDAPPASCPDWWAWATGHGGVDAETTHVQVTLTATRDDITVVVDGVRARVHHREPVETAKWRNVVCPVGGADITPNHFAIDLDWGDPPTTRYVDAHDDLAEQKQPVLSVSKGEVERLDIMAHSSSADVSWSAELLLLVDGKRKTIDIGSATAPFRTVASEGVSQAMWMGDRWEQ